MSAHQKLEHAEHATHAAHHDHKETGSTNRRYGVTMALIGVLIALCSAMLGSERNELTRTMIKQTQSHASYTAASTKLRLLMIELEKQRARVVAARDPQGGESPVKRFIQLANDYKNERNLAKAWADTHEPQVKAQFEGAEGYEAAQVIAEIGIVVASLAVLLSSRAAWMISIVLALACIGQLGRTFVTTTRHVHQSEARIEEAEKAFNELRMSHTSDKEDDKIIERLDPDGKIRAELSAKAENRQPGAPAQEVHNKEPGTKQH